MKEHEYSFVVENAEPYHAFCLNINPADVSIMSLRRRVYKDGSETIARITEETIGDNPPRQYLDFKESSDDSQLAKTVQETPEIDMQSKKVPQIHKLLETLDYELHVDLVKKRTRYQLEGLHVDVDEYTSPYAAVVIELEGEPEAVEATYQAMTRVIGPPKIADA